MSQKEWRAKVSVEREKVVLAAVFPPGRDESRVSADLEEMRALIDSAGAMVAGEVVQMLPRPVAGTYMGSGKVQELGQMVKACGAQAVVFENDLSPAQIRNIEEVVQCKVLDRSELILDIFASRARTHEAKLQVELAQLEYTYPRLKAMWSHLERIVGGIGTRGPGEQQLEIDRRIVQRRKIELKRQIEVVQARKQREVEQRRLDFFLVGLVGYTNAGKSTLFNTLTGADVYADDRLFATLDTRTRRLDLGGGQAAMISDTVGFVRDLPHHLVASFKATLEEAVHSDLLLIVIDLADPSAESHLETVEEVLREIGAGDRPRQLVLNKVDRLADNSEKIVWMQKHPGAIAVSAKTGEGLEALQSIIAAHQRGRERHLKVALPLRDGKSLSFLENQATIHRRDYGMSEAELVVTIGSRQLDQLRASGARIRVIEEYSQRPAAGPQ